MRPIIFTALFYSWSTLASFLVLPLLIGPPGPILAFTRFWVRTSLWLLRVTVGVTHEVRGIENLPAEPALVAVKHQSAWDTLAINLIVSGAAIVLKRELTWIPVFGWCLLRLNHIPIDRTGGLSALRGMIVGAQERLAEGRSIVIFPEGTRGAPGTKNPYHVGIAALNSALDVPVVPVALNSGLFWPRRSLALRPGKIILEILPALPRNLPRRDFVQSLETAIETATNQLIEEAGGLPVDKVVEQPNI
ncbi:MAG: 1-acyl-sn-glycerol-3-phosphate acyltransferase [Alphaproteobacteria bacterium]|jgi:1-acyl-sn-glycerol-3-phosphate acyltransferase|nr:1-acyl-sn-glycerol-3-phosphate acyltransferase [Alphaproteobacteria bacterium]